MFVTHKPVTTNAILSAFETLTEVQRVTEIEFHGLIPSEYKAYVTHFKPRRFTSAMTTKLITFGYTVEAPVLVNYQLKTILQLEERLLPFNHARLIGELSPFLQQFAHLPFAQSMVMIEKKDDIAECVTSMDPDSYPDYDNRVDMLRAGFYVNPLIRVNADDASICVNFRTTASPTQQPTLAFSNLIVGHKQEITISDVKQLREHKIVVSTDINLNSFWYRLAMGNIRETLTDDEVVYIIRNFRIKLPGKTLDDTQLILLCGHEVPMYDMSGYFNTRYANYNRLPADEKLLLQKTYGCVTPWRMFSCEFENMLLNDYRKIGLEALFCKMGGIIPPRLLGNEVQKSVFFWSSLSLVFRRYVDSLHIPEVKTFASVLKDNNIKVFNFQDLVDFNDSLVTIRTTPTCFIPLVPRAKNSTSFINFEPVGTNPYIAYGTLDDYVAYEIDELTTACAMHDDKSITPLRPDDVKKEFEPEDLMNIARFLRFCLADHKNARVLEDAVEYLLSDRALGLERLSGGCSQLEFAQLLFAVIETGFYMRKWRGREEKLPLKEADTKRSEEHDVTTARVAKSWMEIYKYLKPEYRRILARMRIKGARPLEPPNVWKLLEDCRQDKYCIRMASRQLIVTCMEVYTKLGYKLNFKASQVASIS